ncbi:MAG: YggT family protein [Candidatus Omnitrophota bacterium]|nr:MAG: YggT family protein [Candidatus Omnitrophota bacterium]
MLVVLAYIIDGLVAVFSIILTILYWLILIRALISWVNPDPYNPIVQFLRRSTDPILEPISKFLMPLTYKIHVDLSPLVAFFIIIFLQKSLIGTLLYLSFRLKQ